MVILIKHEFKKLREQLLLSFKFLLHRLHFTHCNSLYFFDFMIHLLLHLKYVEHWLWLWESLFYLYLLTYELTQWWRTFVILLLYCSFSFFLYFIITAFILKFWLCFLWILVILRTLWRIYHLFLVFIRYESSSSKWVFVVSCLWVRFINVMGWLSWILHLNLNKLIISPFIYLLI
jgi:hypothetical protein